MKDLKKEIIEMINKLEDCDSILKYIKTILLGYIKKTR